jgi:hypothetical protein
VLILSCQLDQLLHIGLKGEVPHPGLLSLPAKTDRHVQIGKVGLMIASQRDAWLQICIRKEVAGTVAVIWETKKHSKVRATSSQAVTLSIARITVA